MTDLELVVNGTDIEKEDVKQVYACGKCTEQAHRLLEGSIIICGACDTPSRFVHFEPNKKPANVMKRRPRLATSRIDDLENYVCRRCSYNGFHLQESGTITCYRCRHAASFKWQLLGPLEIV